MYRGLSAESPSTSRSRRIADTVDGKRIQRTIEDLEALVQAFQEGLVSEAD